MAQPTIGEPDSGSVNADGMSHTRGGGSDEVRAAKRQHRNIENDNAWKQAQKYHVPSKSSIDGRASLANRRRSGLRDYKPPLGPRPPDLSTNSKRVASESTAPQPSPTRRSFLPSTTSEPFLGLSARRRTANPDYMSQLNPADLPSSSSTQEMPPDHGLDASSSSGARSRGASNAASPENTEQQPLNGSTERPSLIQAEAKPPIEASRPLQLRQRNPALRAAQLSTASASGSPVVTPLTIRTKRQSQVPLPPSSTLPDARQPRKSVGPGLPLQAQKETAATEGTLNFPKSATANSLSPDLSWNFTNTRSKPRASMGPKGAGSGNEEATTVAKRGSRTHSLQPTLRSTPSMPPSATDEVSRDGAQATGALQRPQMKRTNTSSSSVPKRQPFGGLARAVSPTDVKKMKRTSVMPPPLPPVPARTPTSELAQNLSPRKRSPTPPFQKPETPSSLRATPEASQRFAASRALSSRSSFASPVPSNSSLHQQGAVRPHGVKSPSARSDNSDGSAPGELEVVPPVPAIPKAYESPNHLADEPFFETLEVLNPTVSAPDTAVAAQPAPLTYPEIQSDATAPHPPSGAPVASGKEVRNRRRFTLGSKAEPQGASTLQNANNSQRARLPPLNLLPLSLPTSEKITSLANSQGGRNTPPGPRKLTKTPSTPMTASRATFSAHEKQGTQDFDSLSRIHLNRDLRYDHLSRHESSDGSPNTFLTASPAFSVTASSPIPPVPSTQPQSTELDQTTLDVSQKKADPDFRASRVMSLRSRAFSRSGKESSTSQQGHASQPDGANGPAVGKRKMSFGWRRSSSKASHTQANEDAPEPSGDKLPDVPPPKLPVSAAWGDPLLLDSTLKSQTRQMEDAAELKPPRSSAGILQDAKLTNPFKGKDIGASRNLAASVDPLVSGSEKTSSFLSPMHKILASRHNAALTTSAHGNSQQQGESVVADEEMRKLASKKKEFETAAKEVDELQQKATPKERISAAQAAKAANLNIFERGEVIDYPDVYFCGLRDARKYIGDLASHSTNFGYDDERGDYNIVMGDHLAFRYEVVDLLGKGSFGQVVRCIDHRTGKLVAVKIIRNKKRFHQQALVEVNILQRLRDWDPDSKFSNVEFTQSFYFRGHLCIATELLGMNLYEFIKAHDFRGFSLRLIRRFTQQMLSSLCLLQGRKVIHCDLKPENILLAHPLRSDIKVIDFGSSCFENEKVYTYIQSRFYRSPEVILGMDYGMPIDMWSIGCILAELYTGYPIFPGENEQEQLACIMEVFGPPEKHLIERSSRKKLFFDSLGKPRVTVSTKGKRRRPSSKTLQQAIKCDDEAFLDFLTQCLRWDPERRLKPDAAITHDFVTGVKTKVRSATASRATSPAKRSVLAAQTPSKPARPLPDPPATSYKNGMAMNSIASNNSPMKSNVAPRRHSTMVGLQTSAGVKRSSNGAALGSSLPRSVSGKPDMASAAAIASLRQRP